MTTILVVDDSFYQRKRITSVLQENNYDFITAANGQEGLEKVVAEKPDCLLLDLIMPEMGGIEVLEAIKEQGITVPVIVHTSDIQDTTRAQCLELGATAFLNKPLKPDELLSTLAGILNTDKS